jgi:hypothetical protein
MVQAKAAVPAQQFVYYGSTGKALMELHDIETRIKAIQRWIDGVVDDNSIFTNLQFGNTNLITLLDEAQHDAQSWEGLLSSTGGELKLSKCFYYVLSWKWSKIGTPLPETVEEQHLEPMIIKMTNLTISSKLIQKEVTTSHKTLGTNK